MVAGTSSRQTRPFFLNKIFEDIIIKCSCWDVSMSRKSQLANENSVSSVI